MAKHKNPEYAKEFARRLRARMDELGVTSQQLAQLSDLPLTSVYNFVYEDTHVPQADTVVKLANALAVSTDYLINFQV